MSVSDITVSTKLGRAAMYSIIAELPDTASAASLAHDLRTRYADPSPLCALYVLRLSDNDRMIDAYTFDRETAEKAHTFITGASA